MNKIDFVTPQNVSITYELPPIYERLLAFLIDSAIIWGTILSTQVIFLLYDWRLPYLTVSFFAAVFLFYTPAQEIAFNGQSWGKRVFGLRVVRTDGSPPALQEYLIRWAFRSVDIYLSSGALATIMVNASPRQQRLGGVLSQTMVVKEKRAGRQQLKNLLDLADADSYEPFYPTAIRFNEKEMLTISQLFKQIQQNPNYAHKQRLKEMATIMSERMELPETPKNYTSFVQSVLKDYVMLTR